MAVDLTVSLTDQEQAMVEALAARVAPGATPAQIKAWAEKQAKKGLRQAVLEIKRDKDAEDRQAALLAAEAQDRTNFPEVT